MAQPALVGAEGLLSRDTKVGFFALLLARVEPTSNYPISLTSGGEAYAF